MKFFLIIEPLYLTGHADEVYSVAFSNNNLVASASLDTKIKIWNTDTGAEIKTLEGHTDFVLSVAFNNNGLLASGSVHGL